MTVIGRDLSPPNRNGPGTSYIGDGAFKISYDKAVSNLPIIEFYPGDQIDYVYRRGRLIEIVFKTVKHQSGKQGTYRLFEHYGNGYIKYELKQISGS